MAEHSRGLLPLRSLPGLREAPGATVAADRLGLDNPFFKSHDGVAGATTLIDGRSYVNFSSYNYLGLAGHPRVNKAATAAIERYGTSASASRLVAGSVPSNASSRRPWRRSTRSRIA